MCLAIPGKIKQIDRREALVAYPQDVRRAFLGDDVPAQVGDYVLVQMGVVVKKLTAKEADLALKTWEPASQT